MKNILLTLMVLSAVAAAPAAAAGPGRTLYVVNGLSETLSEIDLATGAVTDDIVTLGTWPNDITVRGDRAFVVNSGSEDITVIDLPTETVTGVVDVGEGTNPWSAAVLDDSTIYVTCLSEGTVRKIDLVSGDVTEIIQVGTSPEGMLLAGDRLYVANTGYNGSGYDPGSVSVIDTGSDFVLETLTVGTNPQDLALDPQGEVNVVCTGDFYSVFGEVWRIDTRTNTVLGSVETGGTPGRAVMTASGNLYMAAGGWGGHGEVYLDYTLRDAVLHGPGDPIVTGTGVMDVAVDDRGYLYVACFSAGTVTVFDMPDEPVTSIPVEGGPTALAFARSPGIEVRAVPAARTVGRGETLDYTIGVGNDGDTAETMTGFTALALPGGTLLPGNPVHGPLTLVFPPGRERLLGLSSPIPERAPLGRYVFFAAVHDTDSRMRAASSFWFEVVE
jgi:YVTN family beta-propeller protein